jgi:SHS2 domain-containing protein
MPYRFLEGLTMADVAFEATGRTLEETFLSAADAMASVQIKDAGAIELEVERDFSLKAATTERLLHDFLQELIFYKDAELLLFGKCELKIAERDGAYELIAKARGEKLDHAKHQLLTDVKAVSWHKFSLVKTAKGWKAVVIIDV